MLVQKQTNSDGVYEILRNQILNLKYKPGYPLSALYIAEQFNISRFPAREALLKLAKNYYVDIFPQYGTRVALINLDKIAEEHFLRISLESAAVQDFIRFHHEKDFTMMELFIERQKEAAKNGHTVQFLEFDNSFHKVIFSAIQKPRLWNLMLNFNSNEYRYRLLSLSIMPALMQSVITSHTQLLNAIVSLNTMLAITSCEKHLADFDENLNKLITSFPEIFTKNGAAYPRLPKHTEGYPLNFRDYIIKKKII